MKTVGRAAATGTALALTTAVLSVIPTGSAVSAEAGTPTVVLGSRFADTGLSREHVDCDAPATLLSSKPPLQNALDAAAPAGSHAATWSLPDSTRGVGVLADVAQPSGITDLSISVRAVDEPVTGAAVVRWQPEGLDTSWIGLAALPADPDTSWHTVQAADLVYAWSEISDDGRLVRSGSQQTISNFFVGRDDSAGARVGFVFGCNGAPFLVDGLAVTSPATSRSYDFEAPPSRVALRLSTTNLLYGKTIRGSTKTRTSARVDSVRAVIERRTADGPKKILSMRIKVGRDRWNWTPKQSGAHRVRVLDQDEVRGSSSGWTKVRVRQRVTATPSTGSVQRGRQFVVSGSVRPGEGTRIIVQRLGGAGWKSVAAKTIGGSRYDIKVRADVVGTVRYRVVAARTKQNDKGISSPFQISVTAPPSGGGGGGSGDGGGDTGGGGDGSGGGGDGGGDTPPEGPQRPVS